MIGIEPADDDVWAHCEAYDLTDETPDLCEYDDLLTDSDRSAVRSRRSGTRACRTRKTAHPCYPPHSSATCASGRCDPQGVTIEERPGTVAYAAKGLCRTCYRHAGETGGAA